MVIGQGGWLVLREMRKSLVVHYGEAAAPAREEMILLLALWPLTWDYCPGGEVPVAYRVESALMRPVGSVPGTCDDGLPCWTPIYTATWGLVQEGPDMGAAIPCEPMAGECCMARVTSLDEYGMEDNGENCP